MLSLPPEMARKGRFGWISVAMDGGTFKCRGIRDPMEGRDRNGWMRFRYGQCAGHAIENH